MNKRTSLATVVTSAVIVGLTVFGAAAPAMAASTSVTGEVNCNGNNVYYNTTRYISANSTRIQFKLTKSANVGDGVSYQYTRVGAVVGGTSLGQKSMSIQSPNAVLSGYYSSGTAFKLYASMTASVGICDNIFKGTLYY